jgi:hypothetical protein
MYGWAFGNVGTMTTCAVLRCQNSGSTIVTGGQHLNDVHESYICAEHYEKINTGEHWDVKDGHVLMGQDMPPTATGWSSSDSRGTRGFVLSLKMSDPEAKPFDVFITPDFAKHLHMLTETRRGE